MRRTWLSLLVKIKGSKKAKDNEEGHNQDDQEDLFAHLVRDGIEWLELCGKHTSLTHERYNNKAGAHGKDDMVSWALRCCRKNAPA